MTLELSFSLCVSHGQIAVFDASMSEPFNEWTDQHSAQGFTWRPGSVSFAALQEAGACDVVLCVSADFEALPTGVARVIDVPFELPPSGRVEVASIADSVTVDVLPGLYQLRFEQAHQTENDRPCIKLTLVPSASPTFRIVRADQEIAKSPLLLTARPAGI